MKIYCTKEDESAYWENGRGYVLVTQEHEKHVWVIKQGQHDEIWLLKKEFLARYEFYCDVII